MPLGLLGSIGLPALESVGNITPTAPAVSTAGPSSTGAVTVGGLNAPALPSERKALIWGGVILGAAFLFSRRKR